MPFPHSWTEADIHHVRTVLLVDHRASPGAVAEFLRTLASEGVKRLAPCFHKIPPSRLANLLRAAEAAALARGSVGLLEGRRDILNIRTARFAGYDKSVHS